jgi:prepilin-type N-terminal cleavage/methylation domain-containing protein
MKRSRRGVTLVEIMVVVAIGGVMSSLAAVGMTNVVRHGRVNSAATSLARLATTARQRAMAERCRFVLQINGTTYNPASATADVPRRASVAFLYRKNNCASTTGAYEPGIAVAQRDRLLDEYALNEFFFELGLPTTVVASGRLTSSSVSLSWNELGQLSVWADGDQDGVSTDASLTSVTMRVRSVPGNDLQPWRDVVVPMAGRATAP